MEEIALVVSSLAGACTAVALDKFPRLKLKQVPTISSAVDSQLHSLRAEKEILTKTITRLHSDDSNISRVQKDKLLIRYQHQLGQVIAKIEKLEVASKYPDLGPVGDSLIALMDTKLSKMDQRLHEISSKITVNPQPTAAPTVQQLTPQKIIQETKPESPRQTVQEKPRVETIEPKVEIVHEVEAPKETIQESPRPVEVILPEKHVSVELSTLTTIPNKMPEFPAEFIKPSVTIEKIDEAALKIEAPQLNVPPEPIPKIEAPQLIVPLEPTPIVTSEKVIEAPKPEPVVEKKIELPTPIKIPEEEKIEDDDKDLDKIKSEIMKALSKLEQVEVE